MGAPTAGPGLTEIKLGPHGTWVKVVGQDIDVTVFRHDPEDGSMGYLVIDIDSEQESIDPGLPMRVYRNDGPIYIEGGA